MRAAYDKETRRLYVYTDLCRLYEGVHPLTGAAILGGNMESLERIISLFPPVITIPPKNLHWYNIGQQKIKMYKVNSSNVSYVGYSDGKLYVRFLSGDIYEYSNIPLNLWVGIQNAESKGSFLHWWIKINSPQYPYKKINGNTNFSWLVTTTPIAGTPHPKGYLTGFGFAKQENPVCYLILELK